MLICALAQACNGGDDPDPGGITILPPDPTNASADPTNATVTDGGGQDDEAGSDGDSGGPGPGCDEPSSLPNVDPSPACAPDVPCVSDANCPDGHTCNTGIAPPECTLLFCGAAGTPCHDESACEPGLQCAAGRCNPCTFCGDECAVDFASSDEHCGCCDQPVAIGGVCNDGVAGCPPGQTLCTDTCVDLDTDPDHCGACDNAVAADLLCVGGEPGCPQGDFQELTLCGDKCVDLLFDEDNCGACGVTCTGGNCEGGKYCWVDSETTDSCKNICAAAGMACSAASVAESSASYYGWCDSTLEHVTSCTLHPADTVECGSNPSCICTMEEQECGCVPN